MTAVIFTTDGIPQDVVVFNTEEEAQQFRSRLGQFASVYDRCDIRNTSTAIEVHQQVLDAHKAQEDL